MKRLRRAEGVWFATAVMVWMLAGAGGLCESGEFAEERRVPSQITKVMFWPDADHVIGTGRGKTIKVNLKTSETVWTCEKAVHMAMDPRGRYLVLLANWVPKLINARTGETVRTIRTAEKVNGHPGDVAVSPDGRTVAIATSTGHQVLLSELPGGKPRGVIKTRHPARSVAFSPNGRLLAVSADALPGFSLYDARGRRRLKQITWDGRVGGVATHLVFSPDSRLIAGVLSHRAEVWLWRVRSGRVVRRIKRVQVGRFGTVAFSPDGRWLAANGVWPVKPDNMYMAVRLWDARSGREVATLTDLRHGNGGGDMPFAFSPDGKALATVFDRIMPQAVTIWRWGASAGAGGKPRPAAAER